MLKGEKGKIHSFESMGTFDGPGIRFVIFMQGCPLRCAYCHNPDTWDFSKGMEILADDLKNKILRYRNYFGENGGITVSGGEPLLQADFVREIFKFCRGEGIHTALDTSGCFFDYDIDNLLNYTDLCLLDYKMTDGGDYKKYIGCSSEPVRNFLEELGKRKIPVWLRQVIIPDINDGAESLDKLKELKKEYKCIEKIELLPFKKMCRTKYDEMGIEFPFKNMKEPDDEQMDRMNNYIDSIC